VRTQKCYPPGSKAAARQHKDVCTALYPKVTPPKLVTVFPSSNIYHEHALVKFKYWYQEKTPLKKQCCKLSIYIGLHAVMQKSNTLVFQGRFCIFGRQFVKRFALCYWTVVGLSCLWRWHVWCIAAKPNGWMYQDETWHDSRPRAPVTLC